MMRRWRRGPGQDGRSRSGSSDAGQTTGSEGRPPATNAGLADLLCGRPVAGLQQDLMARHGLRPGNDGFLDELAGAILTALRAVGVRPLEDRDRGKILDAVLHRVELEQLATRTGLSPGTAAHWIWALLPVMLRSLHERGVEALDAPFLRRRASDQ